MKNPPRKALLNSFGSDDRKGISIPEGKNFNQYGGFVNILDATTAVSATNVTIGGGRLFVDGCTYGISASDVTVTGGTVEANSNEGIGINAGTINFTGGNVYVPGGFNASNLNLGWTSGSDSFWGGSYNYETCVVTIADGQAFTDGNGTIFSGSLDESQRISIQGNTLTPYCVTVDYVDADGNTQPVIAIPLSESMTTLAAGTYVVNSDILYDDVSLTTTGDVTLILADGCTMEVLAGIGDAISCGGNLTIYGQTLGTGKLYIYNSDGNGIVLNRKNYNQYGGIVEIVMSMGSYGIDASTVTLSGGTLNISGKPSYGIEANNVFITGGNVNVYSYTNGIWATNVTLTGGNVNISSDNSVGILCDDLFYLGWTKPTDSYYVESYECLGSIVVADGQILTDGYETYSGTLDEEQYYSSYEKTFRPYKAIILADDADNTDAINEWNGGKAEVTLQGRTLYKDGAWNTLCLPFNLTLSESVLDGADVRALSNASLSNGTLTLNFTSEGTVTKLVAGTPYIIKWPSGVNLENPVFEKVTITNAGTATETEYVDFIGTYAPVSFTAGDRSILFMGSSSMLYYPGNNAYVNACRAYFQLKNGLLVGDPNSGVKAFVLNIGEDDATSIHNSQFIIHNEDAGWYSLDGRKFNAKPTKQGIYIHNGRKEAVK